jgi:septal ring factor EnvC (AmiA/AmiB activator)
MRTLISLAFLGAFLAAFTLLPESAYARLSNEGKDEKKQIRKIERDLTREKEQFLKFDAKEKSLLEQISELEQEMANKKQVIDELKRKIGHEKGEVEEREKSLQDLKESYEEVEERVSRRLVAFYKYAKRGYLRLVSTSEDFDHLRKGIYYLDIVMEEDKKLLSRLGDLKEKIGRELAGIRDRLSIIARLEKEETHQLASVKGILDKKVILLMKIHREKEFYETAVKELQSAALDLRDTLVGLEGKDDKEMQLRGFEDHRGRLPPPFAGKILRDHNLLGAGGLTTQKGIFIEGPMGSEVRAVFQGIVEFSGWLKGYGQIIIINHGARFFTISAHLSRRFTGKGATVAGGEVIGLLGQTGLVDRPLLYFEMRRAETNLDPLTWLKLH